VSHWASLGDLQQIVVGLTSRLYKRNGRRVSTDGIIGRTLHSMCLAVRGAQRLIDHASIAMVRHRLTPTSVGVRPRIAFFTIVLNGEPWLEINIRHIYPYATQIFIVEGATQADGRKHYWDGDATGYCTTDGHSIDDTRTILRRLVDEYDPEGKIHVITYDGPWNGKTEMCNSFLHLVDANYLWQLDVDEFYHAADIERIIAYLEDHPDVTSVMFYAKYFFGSLRSIIAGQFGNGSLEWLRIFKFHKDFVWLRHEPPRYGDPTTGKTVETITPLSKEETKAMGVYMYHYSYVLEDAIRFKEQFFYNPGLFSCLKRIRLQLAKGENPVEVHLQKLDSFGDLFVVPFTGSHPEPIVEHWDELLRLEIKTANAGHAIP